MYVTPMIKQAIQDRRLKSITKTSLFKYTENFTTKKLKFLRKKISDIFHISSQYIDCGYSLGGSNEYPQSSF